MTTQAHLRKWFEVAVASQKSGVVKITGHVVSTELRTCAAIINIFHLIPAASTKMIEPLLILTLKGERDLVIEVCAVTSSPPPPSMRSKLC